jgi:hypothetical protein
MSVSRSVKDTDAGYIVELAFDDGVGSPVPARFAVDKAVYASEDLGWGYRDDDLALIMSRYESARVAAFEAARARRASQASLDADLAKLRAEHARKRANYVVSRGFRFRPDGSVEVDMPALVRKSVPRLAALTHALEKARRAHKRPPSWTLSAATALAQTAVDYGDIPAVTAGIHTGGLYPPLPTLVRGRGDCDGKAALLAAVLANIPGTRVLGVEFEGHYLLGISRKPGKDDSFIQYKGAKYVLIEPAGPSWLAPGGLSEETKVLLKTGKPYRVEKLY